MSHLYLLSCVLAVRCCWLFLAHLPIVYSLCFAAWLTDNRKLAGATLIHSAPRPSTCSSAVPALTPTSTMAMSSDPAPERLEPDLDKQSCSLVDGMAAVTLQDSDGHSVRNGARTHLSRPNLSGRKLSLQERGTYSSSGAGRGNMSAREARRPTVESKRVSISDSQVSLR